MSTQAPRSLADQLRGWPDARLSALLAQRPDLASPAPQDCAQLASRAAARASLLRALDLLDRLELAVLDAHVVAAPMGLRAADLVHAAPEDVARAEERLEGLALLWGAAEARRPLTGVADALAGSPGASGLRPCSAAPSPAEARRRRDEVAAGLAAASDAARAMLEHVVEHGGEATFSGRAPLHPEDATGPAEELLARRLLLPRDEGRVIAPGEVGLAVRGGRTTREDVGTPPSLLTAERPARLVDRAAAGAAAETVRRVELLLDHWGTQPASALRAGGLGVRELKAVATLLAVDEAHAALLVEVAHDAGLIASAAARDGSPAWLPTDEVDRWSALPTAERWLALVTAWLDSPRMPGLVGALDPAGKRWNALAPELSGVHQAETRRMALGVLAGLPAGQVLAAGTGEPSLVTRLAWLRPRRPRTRAEQATWALAEAAELGVAALGGLASYAVPLLEEEPARATRKLADLLPPPVDHLLLQADLTAVAPGPLEPGLARRLHAVADVESRGGATVYRFTAGSVRRALDLGWTALELHDFVGTVSRTPVPQPLTYLIDDTARTFGSVRIGHAEAYLRADDEALLTELLHHPKASTLGLRRLAPTVLISSTPPDVLLPRLRELGAAPVVEAPDGTVHVARPDAQRARAPRERVTGRLARERAREAARVAAVVTALRAGDQVGSARPASAVDPAGALVALRGAVEQGLPVVIEYVDNHGTRSRRVIDPLSVEGGRLRARDRRTDDVREFAVPRIVSVAEAADGGTE